jgi:hypothetical protein
MICRGVWSVVAIDAASAVAAALTTLLIQGLRDDDCKGIETRAETFFSEHGRPTPDPYRLAAGHDGNAYEALL